MFIARMRMSSMTSQRRNMSSILVMFIVFVPLQELLSAEVTLATGIKLPQGCEVTMATDGKVLLCNFVPFEDVLRAMRQLGQDLVGVDVYRDGLVRVPSTELNQSCFENNKTFIGPQNLLKLDLSDNIYASIPRKLFGRMHNLTLLDLRLNSISSIDDGVLSDLRNLETLNLKQQRVPFEPSLHMLEGLVNLKTLDLAASNLDILFYPGSHGFYHNMAVFLKDQQNSLKSLDLSSTGFTNGMSPIIRDLKQLEKLHLKYNNLGYIAHGTLPKLNGEWYLDLSSNKIMFIEADVLPYNGRCRICLDDNSFYCDCKLLEFVKWLREYNTTSHGQGPILCSGPQPLYGTKVIDYNPSWWQCSPYVPLIALVAIICLALVLAVIALVVSCNRVNFRHWLLERRIAAKAEEAAEHQAATERTTLLAPSGRLYGISSLPKGRTDAYILYDMNEGDVKRWVDQHIEEKHYNHPMKIKLQWAAGPDFIPLWKQVKDYGLGVKHFLVVVTENLLKDHWPQMSENCSVENLSKFVLVLRGMKKKDLPKDLLRLCCPCLEWPLTAPKWLAYNARGSSFGNECGWLSNTLTIKTTTQRRKNGPG